MHEEKRKNENHDNHKTKESVDPDSTINMLPKFNNIALISR